MAATPAAPRRRMVVLGGSLHHRGGLEAYCERAATAIERHAVGWQADWWPTETAYFSLRRLSAVQAAWRRAGRLDGLDLVWLQWSTLLDLLFLGRVASRGVPVLVTPHLGAAARLQRWGVLRWLARHLLARADRLGLLFDGQEREIALSPGVPRSVIGTFLPESALAEPATVDRQGPLQLIHAGRLSAPKGSFRVVELCALLRDRGIPFHARIVGRADPATMSALTAAIAAAGLGQSVELIEWMDGPTLREALVGSDILVHLSELDSFPLIVLEALAAGTVPIVADMAGAAAMVRDYGGFVTPGSSVVAALDWLAAQDPATLRRDSAAAADRVRRDHAWERLVQRLETIAEATLPDGTTRQG